MNRLLLLLTIPLTACTLGEVTHGEKGNATFAYGVCLSNCGLDMAMMHGTEELIEVKASTIPDVTVTSTAPDVVGVKSASRECCSSSVLGTSCRTLGSGESCTSTERIHMAINVVANASGAAEIVLTQSDGTVFDQVSMTVAEPATIELEGLKNDKLTLTRGTNLVAGWKARDAAGNELMATSGVQLSTSDASIVDFQSTWLSPRASTVDATSIVLGTTIDPEGAGDAIITAKARDASSATLVHVN